MFTFSACVRGKDARRTKKSKAGSYLARSMAAAAFAALVPLQAQAANTNLVQTLKGRFRDSSKTELLNFSAFHMPPRRLAICVGGLLKITRPGPRPSMPTPPARSVCR